MDGVYSWASMCKTNANESVTFRVISVLGSFRRSVARVCGVFAAYLFRPFRATDLGGRPLTQGDARRLRRVALPWANLFCPFGAGPFLDVWPVSAGRGRYVWGMAILRGVVATSALAPSGAIVLTPRRGNDKLAQGRASRRSRDAPPWVAKPPKIHRPEGAQQDQSRDVITNNCEPDVTRWRKFAGLVGQNECQRIGHIPTDPGI